MRGLFAYGIEVGKAVGFDRVMVGRSALHGAWSGYPSFARGPR